MSNDFMENTFPHDEMLYNGHKVVAMPSSAFGGRSVREVVDSRNNTNNGERRRSRSAGRSSGRTSRDIVQDVYDRMGVSYTRGRPTVDALTDDTLGQSLAAAGPAAPNNIIPNNDDAVQSRGRPSAPRGRGEGVDSGSADKFQERFRNAAAISRGRSMEANGDSGGERRSRSLSRGRVANRWPPSRSSAIENNQVDDIAPQPSSAQAASPTLTPSSHMQVSNNNTTLSPTTPGSIREPPPNNMVLQRSSSTRAAPQQYLAPSRSFESRGGDWKKRHAVNSSQNVYSAPDLNDEKKDEDPVMEEEKEESQPKPRSVKDRISAFSGGTKGGSSTARNVRRSYNSQFQSPSSQHKRDFPPKVDIYEKNTNDGNDGQIDEGQTNNNNNHDGITQPPSPAASAAADAAAELVAQNSSHSHRRTPSLSRSSKSSRVAESFLAAVQPSNNNNANAAPVRRNSAAPNAQMNVSTDDSVGDSALSGSSIASDIMKASSPRAGKQWDVACGHSSGKKSTPSWIDKGGSSFTNRNTTTTATTTSQQDDSIEKMIEDRVQARIVELASQYDEHLKIMEARIEDRSRGRIEALEDKLEKVMSMLSMILGAKSNGEI